MDAAIETNAKYNYIRKQQTDQHDGRVPMMWGEHQPTLPGLEQLVPPELLNPAREAAPPGTTPAERAQISNDATQPPRGPAPAPVARPPAAPPPTTPVGPTPPPGATP
jgi:hypothetical protein